MKELAIECIDLSKRYGQVVALDGLRLSIPVGSIFGLLGPNGAGKTTTLRLLVGLSRPSAGRARVAGHQVEVGRGGTARAIGYLSQDPVFYGWMTARELLVFAGRLEGLDGTALRTAVDGAIERAGLSEYAGRRISTYSGGMKQRVGLAQAILHHPAVLLLDEPVSSLDPQGRHDLLEVIRGLRGTATVLLSTHILEDVERVCDTVAILDRGRLLVSAAIDDLLDRFARPVFRIEPAPSQAEAVRAFVERVETMPWTAEVGVDGTTIRVRASDAVAAGRGLLQAAVACGLLVARFEQLRPSLEEVFLQIVAERPSGGAES